nr:hypothetical protein [Tanacetum cinerariifolium]
TIVWDLPKQILITQTEAQKPGYLKHVDIGDTMADMNMPANDVPAEQAPAIAPPTRTNAQILPSHKWVSVSKSNYVLDVLKSQRNLIYKVDVAILNNTNFFRAFMATFTIPAKTSCASDSLGFVRKDGREVFEHGMVEEGSVPESHAPEATKIEGWSSGKKRKPKSRLKLVDEFADEGVPIAKPRLDDEEDDLQRGIEVSLKYLEARNQGPARLVVFKESVSGRFQPLSENPKNKSPVDQYIFYMCSPTTTRPSGNAESPSLDAELADSETESEKTLTPVNKKKDASNRELTEINAGVQDEGQAGLNLGKQDEGQAGSNPSNFTTTTYLNVQENLKLPSEDQVIFEEPPHEEEPEKTNAKLDVQSMVTVLIHQDTSSVPPMTTSVSSVQLGESQYSLENLDEARRKKRMKRNLPKTPFGSPPPQPPLACVSGAPDYLTNDDSIPDEQVHMSDDEDIGNDHLPKADMKKDYGNHSLKNIDLWKSVIKCLHIRLPDLDHLRYGNKGSWTALSISKMKAAHYPDFGLELLVPEQMCIDELCTYDISAAYDQVQVDNLTKEFLSSRFSMKDMREVDVILGGLLENLVHLRVQFIPNNGLGDYTKGDGVGVSLKAGRFASSSLNKENTRKSRNEGVKSNSELARGFDYLNSNSNDSASSLRDDGGNNYDSGPSTIHSPHIAGNFIDVLDRLDKADRQATMDAIFALCVKFMTATSDQSHGVACSLSFLSNLGKGNFRSLFSENLCDGADLTIPLKVVDVTRNSIPLKEELTHIPVWVKLHDVLLHVFLEDGISLIASQIIDKALKDIVTISVLLPEGTGVAASTATWQPIKSKVISEPKNHGNMQKHGAPKVSIFAKEYPCNKLHVKKGGPHDVTSKLSVSTSNPYDVLESGE